MAALSAEQVERFRRDGYLVVDGLFDTESLEPVRRRIGELAAPDAPAMVKGKRQVEPLVEAGEIRADGYAAMKKLAAIAEAHQMMVAPHQGSLRPVAEMAAIHLLATLPNSLIREYFGERRPAALRGNDRATCDRGRAHPGCRTGPDLASIWTTMRSSSIRHRATPSRSRRTPTTTTNA